MSKKIESCPQCSSDQLAATRYQIMCLSCGWQVPASDPVYVAYVEGLAPSKRPLDGVITDAIAALPSDFAASLTTTRSALPADHPVNDPDSLTGAEFRSRRESFGLSAEWLAKQLGVALKTIQRWESGRRPIPEGVRQDMEQLSTAVGVTAIEPLAEHLLQSTDDVVRIPRTGDYLGLPASWWRSLVDDVREWLVAEHGDEGLRAAQFRVVYFDEVEGRQ